MFPPYDTIFYNSPSCAICASPPARMAQSVCQKVPPACLGRRFPPEKQALSKAFHPFQRLARPKLLRSRWNQNKNQTIKHNQIYLMKLVQYQRPGLLWPAFGRLTSLPDELDRLFETPALTWSPALDVQEDKDNYTVRVEVPGLKREDIEVSLNDGSLVISGERKTETVQEGAAVHRQERCYGKFSRVLALPKTVAAGHVKAAYKDGILTVTLPKAEEAKPRQIDVAVN